MCAFVWGVHDLLGCWSEGLTPLLFSSWFVGQFLFSWYHDSNLKTRECQTSELLPRLLYFVLSVGGGLSFCILK